MSSPQTSLTNPVTNAKYEYNYSYLPPLAYAQTVPPAESFTARPDWLFKVAVAALKLVINTIMVGIDNNQGLGVYIFKLLNALKALTPQLGLEAGRNLADAIEQEHDKMGLPLNLNQLHAFLEGVIENFAKDVGEETLKTLINLLQTLGTKTGPANSLDEYAKLFAFIPVPAISQTFMEDEAFAAMRVAGPNPLMIARLDAPDLRLPLTEAQYQSVMGASDSFAAALTEGRVYLADYAIFEGAVNGSFPTYQKYNYAPLALFAVPVGGTSLKPVAIQCNQQPGPTNPIFLPTDGNAWLIAKTIVQIADGNFHEAVSHLGRTHLFVEPFVLATHNQLPAAHPLSQLLTPHFTGTLAINDAAQSSLIAPGGGVDTLMSGSIGQSRLFAVKGALSVLQNVNSVSLPQLLAARGVDDTSKLPDYPYRDDALLLWNALGKWISNYVGHYYADDAAVQADTALRGWVAELVAHDGGRLDNIGTNNQLTTRAELIELLTLVCFTASAQHAAVNFPQAEIMTYAPAMPLAGYTPAPANGGVSFPDFLKLLPPLEIAETQLQVGFVLGSVYYTQLGQYGAGYFTDPTVQGFLAQFQQDLAQIETTINQRNQTRTPYTFLLPSRIPQSINI